MLNTLIKPFQKFPMWLKHPNETATMYRPIVVNDEQQAQEYLAKGYVAPEIDEAAFADAQIQIHLAKQMIAIMTGGQRALEFFTQMQYDHGQLKTELHELWEHPKELVLRLNEIDQRITAIERRLNSKKIRAFLATANKPTTRKGKK